MIAISDTELHKAFQREFPKDLARTTEEESPSEYDFDRIEAEKLVGKRWEDIGPELLQEFFDVASWLNPRAFQYFFLPSLNSRRLMLRKRDCLWIRWSACWPTLESIGLNQ